MLARVVLLMCPAECDLMAQLSGMDSSAAVSPTGTAIPSPNESDRQFGEDELVAPASVMKI